MNTWETIENLTKLIDALNKSFLTFIKMCEIDFYSYYTSIKTIGKNGELQLRVCYFSADEKKWIALNKQNKPKTPKKKKHYVLIMQ